MKNNALSSAYSVEITERVEDPAWDDFIMGIPGGHYTQMALWAQVKAIQGWKPIRLVYRDEDRIVGGAQFLWREIGMGVRIGYVSKGPLFTGNDVSFLPQIIRDLQNIAGEYRLVYLAIQPSNCDADVEALLPQMDMCLNYQGDIEKPATMLIDLTLPVEEIIKRMHDKKRKWVKRAERNLIHFREGTRADIPLFFELHHRTGDRNAFDIQSLEFFQTLWDAFSPHRMLLLILGEYEGQYLNASLMITMRDTLEGYRFGWSGAYPKLYPNEALIWYKMMWGKEHGFHWYDFGGLDLKIAREYSRTGKISEEHLKSYTANKLHYGGELHFFPQTYEYLYQPFLRRAYISINNHTQLREILKQAYKILRSR